MMDFRWLHDLWLGRRMLGQITERLTALPISGNLFTVAGGKIIVYSIVGTITAACDANATATSLVATPTVGTAAAMCTPTNIASYALGDILGITGIPTDALLPAATGGAIPAQTVGVVVQPGTIDMLVAVAGQVTGRVRWTLHWMPLDTAASVLPA
ncbi:MAG: hypothetical protein PHI12_06955 [Dehalococcoidales bacterium]|nr:hypothetical protein [Dehalococcoidales bacterium]